MLEIYDYDVAVKRIYLRPLMVSWEGDETGRAPGNASFSKEGTMQGVVPAQPGTFHVLGQIAPGRLVHLGYEIPGADHPDWEALLTSKKAGVEKEGRA